MKTKHDCIVILKASFAVWALSWGEFFSAIGMSYDNSMIIWIKVRDWFGGSGLILRCENMSRGQHELTYKQSELYIHRNIRPSMKNSESESQSLFCFGHASYRATTSFERKESASNKSTIGKACHLLEMLKPERNPRTHKNIITPLPTTQ